MIARIKGLNYSDLSHLLNEFGWSKTVSSKGLTFDHPAGARLRFPSMKDDEPVVAYHLTMARAAFSDYGILPYEAFDMRILPYLVQSGSAAATA